MLKFDYMLLTQHNKLSMINMNLIQKKKKKTVMISGAPEG